MHELVRVAKFGLTGVVSVAVILAVTSAGVAVGVDTHFSYAVALCFAIATNFLICRFLVFNTSDQPFRAEFLRFVASVGFWRIVEFLGFLILFDVAGWPYQLAVGFLAVVMFGIKFLWCRWFVFRAVERS
jgi:putative flippase GtrA